MKKYQVAVLIDASTTVEVEAENEEQAKELAMNHVERPHLCHHCSREVDIGEVLDVVEVMEITE